MEIKSNFDLPIFNLLIIISWLDCKFKSPSNKLFLKKILGKYIYIIKTNQPWYLNIQTFEVHISLSTLSIKSKLLEAL